MYEIPNGVTQRLTQVAEVTCVTRQLAVARDGSPGGGAPGAADRAPGATPASPGQRVAHRLLGTGHHRRPVVRGDDRPLDQLGVLRQRRDPLVARPGVPRPLLQPQLLGRGLLGACDVPRLQLQPPEHLADLVLTRHVLEVSAHGVVGALRVEQAERAAALGTGGIDPDLHAPQGTPAGVPRGGLPGPAGSLCRVPGPAAAVTRGPRLCRGRYGPGPRPCRAPACVRSRARTPPLAPSASP